MGANKIFGLVIGILLSFSLAAAETINVPIIGRIDLNLSTPFLGLILGLADGIFNPCALSVLFFFIAYLISIGSKRKSLILGSVYCLMIFSVYTLFMYGISFLITIIGYIGMIKTIAGYILILIGLVQIKDFFFYGKWFSLEIPKSAKPKIEKLVSMATIPSAILLGIFVSFVEIPCAGAFPFAYTAVLVERTSGLQMFLYLVWYNIFFVAPIFVLNLLFYFGLMKVEKAEDFRKKFRKYMRLISGFMLLILGLLFVFKVW
ncbi:MAG: hypothetical protein COY38_02590 [Candidatus Aenigmarchaeota archaeon CG_4_10_14_0_8_um_filter_37_24]|nr:hypothetical protein [Candidatus Aenigmarchaeota archaeon]OIN87911.1 MAG: hypothetical protein AUJ50_02265 [Candidatus Aenigmarchaeota archaeon CG1_02_38_14]PIV67968.1 MAG: hypothetical protein COS07_05680 [Candidatus Aenigmarchaeota archaeon CG01_land_8_20_14_3_00_37_9]PIW41041.1 MAG: hypothetical protein COW21_03975 [Candidatus Aenigmarchaeota archaeon CG15_BIG_FIL_POST_REV_8_21_14_020_37_27]PIX51185.1 MAG: hypothetical protein COZ52_00115 [Candidatus Aenigmarchaeota archaeon CG_4_8_14_3_u